ncbi:MAG: glycerophosphodiester phosphodiesterase [Candidatus Sumerlaeota bacterium]|nr:glycerophosphodiester phosphodiesterase [Candidatus Sumerlaeota bacterium]
MIIAQIAAGCAASSPPASATPPLIVAHRGSSHSAPENTLPAYALAWKQNADAGECDIYMSRDGRIMVIHDGDTSRTAGAALKVKDTESARLRQLDAGRWKDAKYAGTQIPFLEEIIAGLPVGKRLFVEIKCGREALPALRDVIAASGKTPHPPLITLIGFELGTIVEAKAMMPALPAYWLRGTVMRSGNGKKIPQPHDPAWAVTAKSRGLDGLDVHYEGLTPEFAAAVKAAGLGLHAWTVDDAAEAQRLMRLGVDSITTNRPDFIREALGGRDARAPRTTTDNQPGHNQ